jgi:hypothetical protein
MFGPTLLLLTEVGTEGSTLPTEIAIRRKLGWPVEVTLPLMILVQLEVKSVSPKIPCTRRVPRFGVFVVFLRSGDS